MTGEQTYEHNGWPKFVACLIAAVGIALAGEALNRGRAAGDTHTFFFLDMQAWAPICVLFGIFFSLGSC